METDPGKESGYPISTVLMESGTIPGSGNTTKLSAVPFGPEALSCCEFLVISEPTEHTNPEIAADPWWMPPEAGKDHLGSL